MTAVPDVRPGEDFRLAMLWTDSRYRSVTIQIVALVAVFVAGYGLFQNVVQNLADLGKEFGFQFMTTPASYDINQRPLDYTSRDSHARAAVIGMINTLLVAVIGCALATVIGVLAGVARLSKNWIVARLLSVYVEVMRNVPVLIQILLAAAIINETLPAPRAFRGVETGAIVATNRGIYFPAPVMGDGSLWVVVAFLLGIVGAVVVSRWATARQQATGEPFPILRAQAGLVLGLPILAWVATGFSITLEYPTLQGFNFQGGIFARDSYVALTLALAIYTGAFIAENVRAGIQAVSKGQTEAAASLGLQPGRVMSLVVLPQALRIIIPPLISQYLNLTKNSSLALLVGYMDVTGTLGGITLNQTGKEFETLFLLMAFYLSVSLSISAVMNLYNQATQLVERTSATGLGLSAFSLVDGLTGRWELLKKGDALMQPGYGIRKELNLYVLFYALVLAALISYVFLARADDARPSWFTWSLAHQAAALAMIAGAFGALITCLFKNARFFDMAVLELAALLFALVAGFPMGALAPSLGWTGVVALGLLARVAILAWTAFGERPNLTFFHRVREGR